MVLMVKRAGFLSYVKKAFANHWHLMFLGAGVVVGAFSGHADIVLPVVAAGELAYLAALAGNPKFQAHVDAQEHKAAKETAHAQVVAPSLERIFAQLEPRGRARFEQLRGRCRDLRQMSGGLRATENSLSSVDQMQVEGVNRLLWVFLKLLYSQHLLQRFLATTNRAEIEKSVADIEQKLRGLGPESDDTPNNLRIRRSLTDTLASANLRLENYRKAEENSSFIVLELDRIDSKITSIAELAVNRQDPDFISREVDGVASTVAHTEETIGQLHLATDFGDSNANPPAFLDEKLEVS
jgi:hypothetical protein